MTSAPIPAAPDLMTMLCRVGEVMREAVPSGVFMQLLLIGAICPRFGSVLQAWLFVEERLVEERLGEGSFRGDAGMVEGGDGDGGMRSGWLSKEGPVWRWRQVTRFGSVLVIAVRWFVGRDEVSGLRLGSVRVPAWISVSPAVLAGGCFFGLDWLAWSRRALFVPVC